MHPSKVDLIRNWCAQNGIGLCVLFGSQATGKTHQASDIDLAIWPAHDIVSLQRLQWIAELESLLEQDVSLVVVSAMLDPVLGMEIVRSGQVIAEASPHLWRTERARLWHAYNDSLPFRRAALADLKQFAKEVLSGH